MITAEDIKKVVEEQSNIDDISKKNRKRHFVEARFVYMHICKKHFKNISLQSIGSVVKRDHSTVIHGLKEFEKLFNQNTESLIYLYKRCIHHLEKLDLGLDLKNTSLDSYNIKEYYRIKHITLVEKSHKIINKYRDKLTKIQTNPFLKRVSNLTDEQLQEMEFKFDTFLRVKEKLNKTVNN